MSIEKVVVNGIASDIRDVEDVNAESARAMAAESALQSSIETEAARAKDAEAALHRDLASEAQRAVASENVLQESVSAEIARAQNAEATLQANITAEAERAKAAEQTEKTRALAAEEVLRDGTTQRFGSIEEATKTIMQGLHDFTLAEVVYYKPGKMFVAKGKDGNLYDTWEGSNAYMSRMSIRQDKVYICGSALYVWNGTELVDVTAELKQQFADLIGEAPDTLDSIHEIAAWINNDKSGAAALAAQISENKAAITTESERAKGVESQLDSAISTEAQRATGVEAQLQSKIDADVAAEATRAQAAEKELNARKADEDGYHPKMTTGFSDNLVGRGEAVESQFNYRPSGGAQSIEDGVARIERIKGNSIAWNQLAKAQTGTYINGVTIESVGDGSYKVYSDVDTPSTADVLFPVTDTLVYGRKVVFFGSSDVALCTLKAENSAVQDNGSGAIISSTATGERVCIYVPAGTTINTAITIHPQVFDLTQMFGAGREPSLDEFRALYPLNNYAYSAGELRSLSATAIKSVGFNALNLAREKGTPKEASFGKETKRPSLLNESIYVVGLSANNYFNPGQVSNCKVDGGRIAVKSAAGYGVGFAVKTIPNTTYWLQYSNSGDTADTTVSQYDATGVFLTYDVTTPSGPFTTRANTAFCVIIFKSNGLDREAIYDSICLNISHTGYRDGEVEDYKVFTRELPIKEYFPDGMKSAGEAFDEITKDEAVKRIGVVQDLSGLTWIRVGEVFYAVIPDIAKHTKNYIPPLNYSKTYPNDKSITINEGNLLYIKDLGISDTAELKQLLANVPFYYELAEPTKAALSDSLNLDYNVSDFGTEEAIFEGGSAPFRADIVYGFNAVDTIRNNRTSIQELLARIEALESKVS